MHIDFSDLHLERFGSVRNVDPASNLRTWTAVPDGNDSVGKDLTDAGITTVFASVSIRQAGGRGNRLTWSIEQPFTFLNTVCVRPKFERNRSNWQFNCEFKRQFVPSLPGDAA
jgi:hypothetical protein